MYRMSLRTRSLLFPLLLAFSSLLLSGCGGGGGINPDSEAQGTSQPDMKAQAVPGTWTGRAPKYEVINGITVPPEPAPSINNATLAGVDINNNGVRDDVERAIAVGSMSAQQFLSVTTLARAYQTIIITPTPPTRANGLQIERLILCSMQDGAIIPETLAATSNTSLETLTFNTEQRKDKLHALHELVGGYDSEEINCAQ